MIAQGNCFTFNIINVTTNYRYTYINLILTCKLLSLINPPLIQYF